MFTAMPLLNASHRFSLEFFSFRFVLAIANGLATHGHCFPYNNSNQQSVQVFSLRCLLCKQSRDIYTQTVSEILNEFECE